MKQAFKATTKRESLAQSGAPLHIVKAMLTKNTGVAKAGHAGVWLSYKLT